MPIDIENPGADEAALVAALAALNHFSGAAVKKSGDETTANYTTQTAVTFDAEIFDTDGYHDNVTNNHRLTVSSAGYYEAVANMRVDSITADLWASLNLRRYNSSDVEQQLWGSNTETGQGILRMSMTTGPVLCAVGDYFTISLQVETDTSISLIAAFNTFSIKRLGV